MTVEDVLITTLTITLDDSTAAFVEQQRQAEGFQSAEEYLRSLLAQSQRASERRRLTELVREGLDSELGPPADDLYWRDFHQRLQADSTAKAAR